MTLLQSGSYYPDGDSLARVDRYQIYNIVTILCEHMEEFAKFKNSSLSRSAVLGSARL